jgi:hypothetical protein
MWIFTSEAAIKIFALGLYSGKKTYLKNGWNFLDFIIVVAGLLEFSLQLADVQGINLRPLRTLRILRPLKAVKQIPSLKKQI